MKLCNTDCIVFFFKASPIYTNLGVFDFLKWPKNESMQVMIGPAWSRNAEASALACGAWRVVQVTFT